MNEENWANPGVDWNSKSNWEKIFENSGYSPERIGCYVLSTLGYHVKQYLKGDISVQDDEGNMLFFSDLPEFDE